MANTFHWTHEVSGTLLFHCGPADQVILSAWWNPEDDTMSIAVGDGRMHIVFDGISPTQFEMASNTFNTKSLAVAIDRDEHLSQRTQPMETR